MSEYYQNLGMPDDEAKEKVNRKHSRYWNEGKWKYFIEPLLPKDCEDMTFVDVGCNAGLFLKLAKDKGFRDVIGIEKDEKAYQRAIKFRDYLGYDYKVLNRTIGRYRELNYPTGSIFNFDEIPIADVTLLSNVHYYFDLGDWLKYLDRLQHKTCYCLIISRHVRMKHHWRPRTTIPEIKYYFRDWEGVDAIYKQRYGFMVKKDPSPRVLWSFLFRSKLRRKKFSNLHPGAPGRSIKIQRDELIKEVSENEAIKLEKTSYYKAWEKRMKNHWPKERIHQFVKEKVDLMFDIKRNGMKEPILVQMDNKIIDGGHRIAILKGLGYKSIITRTI